MIIGLNQYLIIFILATWHSNWFWRCEDLMNRWSPGHSIVTTPVKAKMLRMQRMYFHFPILGVGPQNESCESS